MPPPALTILLPTYRRPLLLARALRSIQAQTRSDFTVLVCDNASGDETESVVRGFMAGDARIRYHRHAQNLGALANFAFAFSKVDTEFFCLFSDDDVLLPAFVQVCLDGLLGHPAHMAWSGIVLCAGPDGYAYQMPDPAWPVGPTTSERACCLIASDIRPQNTGVIFRRKVLVPEFHPPHDEFHIVDVLWMLQAAANGGIGFTPTPVAIFFVQGDSTSCRAMSDARARWRLLWPSANLILRYAPQGVLTDSAYRRLRRQLARTYGIRNIRYVGRLAAEQGHRDICDACVGVLWRFFGDLPGVALLRLLMLAPIRLRKRFGDWRRSIRSAEPRHGSECARRYAAIVAEVMREEPRPGSSGVPGCAPVEAQGLR
jgi:glycosyltransferase involved in cell wall biosynthesis